MIMDTVGLEVASRPPRILVVEPDPAGPAALAPILSRGPLAAEVEVVTTGAAALRASRALHPDLVISTDRLTDVSGSELCRRLRAASADPPLFLLATARGAPPGPRAIEEVADELLALPAGREELLGRVMALLRTRELRRQLQADEVKLEAMHDALEGSIHQMVDLLMHLLDLRVPGAARRGRELADSARRLADRFEVPAEFLPDLEWAALLHEIGRIMAPAERPTLAPAGVPPHWGYVVTSAAILRQVQRFRGAAELVGSIFENWDGTGVPEHRQRGQIPFRSRLLRVLIDYNATRRGIGREGGRSIPEALQELTRHTGTRYDPLVVGRLIEVAGQDTGALVDGTRDHVPVAALQEGMVLANDLCTGSGTKLLSRGATLTQGHLDIILRRHLADPIIQGAWIERGAGQ